MNVVHEFIDAALSVPFYIWPMIVLIGIMIWLAIEAVNAPIDNENVRPTTPSRDARGRRTGESPPLSPSSQKQRIRDAHADWCGHRSARPSSAGLTARGHQRLTDGRPNPSRGPVRPAQRRAHPGSS